ncbi:MAG: LysR substrate-binding domain-containing protein [Burkholderiales bacterium]
MPVHSAMSLSHLKFRHLMLVLHLLEFRNLHKTAEYLSISQPAASAMLANLESLLGLKLFVRSRQGTIATKEAFSLAERARSLVNEFDALAQTVERLREKSPQLVRIGVVPQAFVDYLPTAFACFRKAGGNAALRTQEGTAQQLVSLLFEGLLDCVVGRLASGGVAEEKDLRELSFTPLYDEQICVIEGTADARKTRPSYAKLAKRDWVLQRRDSSVRRELADAFLRRGLMLPEPVVETANYMQNLSVVGKSNYCSVAPRRAVEMYLKLGTVRIVNVPLDIAPMPVSFIMRKTSASNTNLVLLRESFAHATRSVSDAPKTPHDRLGAGKHIR